MDITKKYDNSFGIPFLFRNDKSVENIDDINIDKNKIITISLATFTPAMMIIEVAKKKK